MTVGEGSVRRLRPRSLPAPPYPSVGEKYYGKDLPLWVFILEPAGEWRDEGERSIDKANVDG